jgi:hypothetical protein
MQLWGPAISLKRGGECLFSDLRSVQWDVSDESQQRFRHLSLQIRLQECRQGWYEGFSKARQCRR